MNSAFEGLQPSVGLRRPGRCLLRRRRPTPGAQRPERPISIGGKASGRRSACAPNEFGLERPSAIGRPVPTGRSHLRRRRPTPGAQRPERPISIGGKASGRRSACAPNEFGLERPSAIGRPVPTGRSHLRRRRPTPGAQRPERPISIGGKASGRRSACAPNEFGLERPSAIGRPVPTGRSHLRRRRPTPGAQRPERPISIGGKASGRRSACAPNEFGLERPSAIGRPVPTGRSHLRRRRPTPGAQRPERPISIGGKASGRRSACAPNEFGLERPSAIGRPVPTGRSHLRRRRPTPGAQRPERPISIGGKAFGHRLACAPNEFGL
jgi:hypothetical protein